METAAGLVQVFQDLWQDPGVTEYVDFLQTLTRTVLIPLSLALLSLLVLVTLVKTTCWRYLSPPSLEERHAHVQSWYRKGRTQYALKRWERMKDDYGPALLSLAAHYIYVSHDSSKGTSYLVLRTNKKTDEPILFSDLQLKQMEQMRDDARAIQQGDLVMVELNARLAKYEHLGIVST